MSIFEKLGINVQNPFSRRRNEGVPADVGKVSSTEIKIGKLHKDFRILDGPWAYNRAAEGFVNQKDDIKLRFGFDNPALLDDCPFAGKLGKNEDQSIPTRWIGFAYVHARDEDKMRTWRERFPYVELIRDLDSQGISRPDSRVEILNS